MSTKVHISGNDPAGIGRLTFLNRTPRIPDVFYDYFTIIQSPGFAALDVSFC
jgi:hypothetical protein